MYLKTGKSVVIKETSEIVKIVSAPKNSLTVTIDRDGKIETIARDAITILTWLLRLWLSIRTIFNKK